MRTGRKERQRRAVKAMLALYGYEQDIPMVTARRLLREHAPFAPVIFVVMPNVMYVYQAQGEAETLEDWGLVLGRNLYRDHSLFCRPDEDARLIVSFNVQGRDLLRRTLLRNSAYGEKHRMPATGPSKQLTAALKRCWLDLVPVKNRHADTIGWKVVEISRDGIYSSKEGKKYER